MKEKILEWAKEKGILEKATPKSQFLKTVEEVGELASSIGKNDINGMMDDIGDIYVTLVIQAELNGLDIDDCIAAAYDEISGRTGQMVNGIFVKDE